MQRVKEETQGMRDPGFCVRVVRVGLIRGYDLIKIEGDEGAGRADIWGNAFLTEGPARIPLEWERAWLAGTCGEQQFSVDGEERKRKEEEMWS